MRKLLPCLSVLFILGCQAVPTIPAPTPQPQPSPSPEPTPAPEPTRAPLAISMVEGTWEIVANNGSLLACIGVDLEGRVYDWRDQCTGPNIESKTNLLPDHGKVLEDELELSAVWGGIAPRNGITTITVRNEQEDVWLGTMATMGPYPSYESVRQSIIMERSHLNLNTFDLNVSDVEFACRFQNYAVQESIVRAGWSVGKPYATAVIEAIEITTDDLDGDRKRIGASFRDCWLAIIDDVHGVN